MSDFKPNFDHIEAGEPSEFTRKYLIEFVKQYAEFKGVSQKQIAVTTGFRQSNVSRILSAKYSPTLDNFLRIVGALNLHIDLHFAREGKAGKKQIDKQDRKVY